MTTLNNLPEDNRSKPPEWVIEEANKLQKKLELENWEISVYMSHIEGGDGATFDEYRYQVATIYIDHSYITSPFWLKRILYHEMLEVFFSELNNAVLNRLIDDIIPEDSKHLSRNIYKDAKERVIQSLTRLYTSTNELNENTQ